MTYTVYTYIYNNDKEGFTKGSFRVVSTAD